MKLGGLMFYEMWERWFVATLAQSLKDNQQRAVETAKAKADEMRKSNGPWTIDEDR